MSVKVMNKVIGDSEKNYKHFELITGHHMKQETTIKHNEQPLSDIIAKFHKIKEDRFKPKDKNPFCVSKPSTDDQNKNDDHIKFETKPRPQRLESLIDNRPQSASQESKGGQHDCTGSRRGRRMSLPSIFHPVTPRPVYNTVSSESVNEEDQNLKVYHTHRRHSMSHVMTEYSKHNLEHLSKIHEMRLKELNQAADPSKEKKKHNPLKSKVKDDDDTAKWLTGDDIHAFYNMWENKGKKSNWRKKLHIRKVLSRTEAAENGGKEGQHRPRVFSF